MTTLHEINQKARQALLAALGPVDYTRYQQQFSQGAGDYTAERQQRSGTTSEVIQQVSELKATGSLVPPRLRKPLHLLTPEEKAELVAYMKEQFAAEEFFTGVLGNRHAVVLPRRRVRKAPAKKAPLVAPKRTRTL